MGTNNLYKIIVRNKGSAQLGHVSNNSDKYYYSMEEDKLKMCCLDDRWIGVKTWK